MVFVINNDDFGYPVLHTPLTIQPDPVCVDRDSRLRAKMDCFSQDL